MVFSAGLVSLRGQPLFFVGSTDAIWPAVTNTGASWCQYSSPDARIRPRKGPSEA